MFDQIFERSDALRRQLASPPVDYLGVAEAVVVGDPRIRGNLNERQVPDRAGDLQIVRRLASVRQDVRHDVLTVEQMLVAARTSRQKELFPSGP